MPPTTRLSVCTLSFLVLLAALTSSFAQGPAARPQVCISGFYDLYLHPDEWQKTRPMIDSVIVADHSINARYTDAQLKTMFDDLNNWNIKFTLEVGAVKPWGPTGAKCFVANSPKWDRFQRLGAHISAIAMDEPLVCARYNLKLSDDYAVQETAAFIALVRQHYPQILVGDIETYPSTSVDDHFKWITALNARLASLGVRGLDFYRIDTNWAVFTLANKGTWRDVVKIEQYCRSIKLPFSLIYWAAEYPAIDRVHLAADDTWYEAIFQQGYDYALCGGAPDEYCIESWLHNHAPGPTPVNVVPDTSDFTFTRSVHDFVGKFVEARTATPGAQH